MKIPWLSEDQKFAIGATIIFMAAAIILSALYGCASVFDAPVEQLIKTEPIQYRPHWDKTPVQCEYMRDGFRWTMMVPRNECKGWTPL